MQTLKKIHEEVKKLDDCSIIATVKAIVNEYSPCIRETIIQTGKAQREARDTCPPNQNPQDTEHESHLPPPQQQVEQFLTKVSTELWKKGTMSDKDIVDTVKSMFPKQTSDQKEH
jgi:hypothetical protein